MAESSRTRVGRSSKRQPHDEASQQASTLQQCPGACGACVHGRGVCVVLVALKGYKA